MQGASESLSKWNIGSHKAENLVDVIWCIGVFKLLRFEITFLIIKRDLEPRSLEAASSFFVIPSSRSHKAYHHFSLETCCCGRKSPLLGFKRTQDIVNPTTLFVLLPIKLYRAGFLSKTLGVKWRLDKGTFWLPTQVFGVQLSKKMESKRVKSNLSRKEIREERRRKGIIKWQATRFPLCWDSSTNGSPKVHYEWCSWPLQCNRAAPWN